MLGSADGLDVLSGAGVDIANLCNNHIVDFGPRSSIDTIAALESRNMSYFGVEVQGNPQKPLILEKSGIKVGVLSYIFWWEDIFERVGWGQRNYTVKPAIYSRESLVKDLDNLKEMVNFTIIMVHWDVEYSAFPAEAEKENPQWFTNTYHEAVFMSTLDIDAVIGMHPHVTQPHTIINGTFIAFSLGNLNFPSHLTRSSELYRKFEVNCARLSIYFIHKRS